MFNIPPPPGRVSNVVQNTEENCFVTKTIKTWLSTENLSIADKRPLRQNALKHYKSTVESRSLWRTSLLQGIIEGVRYRGERKGMVQILEFFTEILQIQITGKSYGETFRKMLDAGTVFEQFPSETFLEVAQIICYTHQILVETPIVMLASSGDVSREYLLNPLKLTMEHIGRIYHLDILSMLISANIQSSECNISSREISKEALLSVGLDPDDLTLQEDYKSYLNAVFGNDSDIYFDYDEVAKILYNKKSPIESFCEIFERIICRSAENANPTIKTIVYSYNEISQLINWQTDLCINSILPVKPVISSPIARKLCDRIVSAIVDGIAPVAIAAISLVRKPLFEVLIFHNTETGLDLWHKLTDWEQEHWSKGLQRRKAALLLDILGSKPGILNTNCPINVTEWKEEYPCTKEEKIVLLSELKESWQPFKKPGGYAVPFSHFAAAFHTSTDASNDINKLIRLMDKEYYEIIEIPKITQTKPLINKKSKSSSTKKLVLIPDSWWTSLEAELYIVVRKALSTFLPPKPGPSEGISVTGRLDNTRIIRSHQLGVSEFCVILSVQIIEYSQSRDKWPTAAMKVYKEDNIESAIREVATLKRLQSPYIVQLYDSYPVLDDDGCLVSYHLIETLCNMGDLYNIITSRPGIAFSISTCLWLTEQIEKGLKAVHNSNLVMVDVKLENIGLTSSGTVKLFDFASAYLLPDHDYQIKKCINIKESVDYKNLVEYDCNEIMPEELIPNRSFVFSSPYMPPNVLSNDGDQYVNQNSDLWAAGICCWWLATGCAFWSSLKLEDVENIIEQGVLLSDKISNIDISYAVEAPVAGKIARLFRNALPTGNLAGLERFEDIEYPIFETSLEWSDEQLVEAASKIPCPTQNVWSTRQLSKRVNFGSDELSSVSLIPSNDVFDDLFNEDFFTSWLPNIWKQDLEMHQGNWLVI